MASVDASAARIAAARSFLFVPGNRADRFDKACAAGADIVVIDLEDAVPPDAKDAARSAVAAWLSPERLALVRINGGDSEWFERDLALLDHPGLLGVMLPKAQPGPPLGRIARIRPVVALIETAVGMLAAPAIAAEPGVVRLAFGTVDLSLDLGLLDDAMLPSLGMGLVLASRAAAIAPPIDGVSLSLNDPVQVEADMRAAHARGFGAKLCVHPAQLDSVHRAFAPTAEALERARRIVAADKAAQGAAVALDGRMIDRPVVERAYRTLRDGMRVDGGLS